MRRFFILLTVLQLVAGNLIGLAHAQQLENDSSALQGVCQDTTGNGEAPSLGSCDVCSHGLVSGIGTGSGAGFVVVAQSKLVTAEESVPRSWVEHPAGEPPK